MSSRKSHKKQLFYEDNQEVFENSPSFRNNNIQGSSKKSVNKSRYSGSKSAIKRNQGSIGLKNKLIDFLIKAAEIERKLEIIK